MKTKSKLSFKGLPTIYGELCRLHLPRPIRDKVDYTNTVEITDTMALWQNEFTTDQGDYFELLCTLIEHYDSEHAKWPKLTVRERLRHLLEQHGLTAADLSRMLKGSRNLGSMILRGERNLTIEHIRQLAGYFKVSPALFF